MNKHKKILFIVGVGRSGTSLLQSMLNAHHEICFLPETHFFRKYLTNTSKKKSIESKGNDYILRLLEKDEEYNRCNISINDLTAELINNNEVLSLTSIYIAMLNKYAEKNNKQYVGDKDPKLIESLDIISKTLPDSIIINIIRDPRDVLCSRMKADWSSGRHYLLHVLIYYFQLSYGRSIGKKLFGEKYIELRYEDLLSNTDDTLKELCNKCEIPYSDLMLSFQDSSAELIHKSEMQWKATTLGPLLKNNYGKWKNELNSVQVLAIESICGDQMHEFDYKISGKNSSVMDRITIKSIAFLSPLLYQFYKVALKFK